MQKKLDVPEQSQPGLQEENIVPQEEINEDLNTVLLSDENEVFENDLSDLDIELLAMGMTLAWLDQTLNSTELTLQFLGGKEEKFYSQANHIAELRNLRADTLREMQQLYTYDTYNNNDFFNN